MLFFIKLSHRLEIEAGRWVRPNRVAVDERKCTFCQTIEDEYHFVIECALYSQLRKQYIPRYFWNRPSMFKFTELINTTNVNTVRKLSIYIYKAIYDLNCCTETGPNNLSV